MRVRRLLVRLTVVGFALAGSVIAASPAGAATSCYNIPYGAGDGMASANCVGNGLMRFVVSCNALPPFQPWTQRSPWITVTNGGQSVAYRFPSCAAPASVSVEYA